MVGEYNIEATSSQSRTEKNPKIQNKKQKRSFTQIKAQAQFPYREDVAVAGQEQLYQ